MKDLNMLSLAAVAAMALTAFVAARLRPPPFAVAPPLWVWNRNRLKPEK